MSVPTMRQVLPKEFIPPLTVLGKYDWLRWEPVSSDPPATGYRLNLSEDQTILRDRRIGQMLQMIAGDVTHLLHFYIYSKALAGGPKLLRPTTERRSCRHVIPDPVEVMWAELTTFSPQESHI